MQHLQEKHCILSRAVLDQMVQDTRARTLALVADLDEAHFEVPLLALVNPFRWELGHVTFFYEAFVLQMLGHTTPLLAGAADLYDSFTVDHDDRWSLPLPSRQHTFAYMQRVLDAVLNGFRAIPPAPWRPTSICSRSCTKICTGKR
jgi:iron(II)-dependent oxidoreductase